MDTDNNSQKSASMGIIFDVPKTPKENSSGPEKNSSHLSNHGDVFDVAKVFQSEHGEAGTIISDRRHHRQSLGESFKKAFDEWWGNAKGTVEKAVATIPKLSENDTTVAAAATRTDIVNKAVKHSALPPRDDHHVVLEQFHTLKDDVARIPGAPQMVIKQPSIKSTASTWSHLVDESPAKQTGPKITIGQIDLRSSMIAPDVARKGITNARTFVPQKQPIPQIPKIVFREPERVMVKPAPDVVSHSARYTEREKKTLPQPIIPAASVPQSLPQETRVETEFVPSYKNSVETQKIQTPAQEHKNEIDVHTTIPTDTIKTLAPVKPHREMMEQPVPVPPRIIEPIQTSPDTHVFHTTHLEPHVVKQREQVANAPFDFSVLFSIPKVIWLSIGGVVLCGVMIASVVGIYSMSSKSNPPHTYTVASFFPSGTPVGIPLTKDRVAFHTLFAEQLSIPNIQSVQVYPTLQEGTSLRPATSKEFFAVLGMQLPHALMSSIENSFMIGGIMTTVPEPYLIIRSYNFDALFAGLLRWEGTMQKDLSPLFGTLSATSTLFTDAVQNNRSTRILRDVDGKEILLYSFINQNQDTVIITTSGEALSALLEKF